MRLGQRDSPLQLHWPSARWAKSPDSTVTSGAGDGGGGGPTLSSQPDLNSNSKSATHWLCDLGRDVSSL